MLRPSQITLGAMVLVCKDENVLSIADLEPAAAQEIPGISRALEITLSAHFRTSKFNYLALMMVDPHVHFHIIPRYEVAPLFDGQVWPDTAWPKMADLTSSMEMSSTTFDSLRDCLQGKITQAFQSK